MKKILTVGVYDLLHYGHVELFRKAKDLGDFLIVAVQNSDYISKFKPNTKIINSTAIRMYMVNSIKYVDEVITYNTVDEIVRQIDFDIFVKGSDQNHEAFQRAVQWCLDHKKCVITLPRTEGVSSSMIKKQIQNAI